MIVKLALSLHPPTDVATTVYVVVVAGLAVTEEPVVELKPVEGLQLYVVAPLAFTIVDPPAQIEDESATTLNAIIPTFIVTESVLLHVPFVPVTVYVIVLPGFAVGFGQLVHVNPALGLQVYDVAPLAVNATLPPLQMVDVAGNTVIVGVGITVIVIFALSLQFEPDVPITVYVVVVAGLAVTEEPVVELKPVAGLQV